MESGNPTFHERSPYKANVNGSGAGRKVSPLHQPKSPMESTGSPQATPLVVRVTVVRDDRGYGMKVSGDNPVYVQSVKEGGAAERAGLHAGDKILKVNGVNVVTSTHTEVVQLIRSSIQVELTVQQRMSLRAAMGSPGQSARPVSNSRITGPQPVDNQIQYQFQLEREQQYRMMIEQERQYVDKLRSEIANSHDDKKVSELAKTERNLQYLQGVLQKLIQSQRSPLTTGSYNLPSPNGNTGFPPPPPLPRRNSDHVGRVSNANNGELVDNCVYAASPPPPLPPRGGPVPPALPDHDKPNSINKQMSYPLVATFATLVNHCSTSTTTTTSTNHHQHHRTKSSPESLMVLSPADASKRLIASESMNHFDRLEGWETPPPPGTPPPPYPSTYSETDASSSDHTNQHLESLTNESHVIHAATPQSGQQPPIISMEDDEMSDQELNQVDDHGPFKSLACLRESLPHLAVFTNYVLCNSNPDCLFFYLLTDLYKEGNAKEMRKWAFEIHSCFLVPGAPLRLPNVDENIAREVDDVLYREFDKEEILRKIFWKARAKSKEELTKQLTDFKQKRTAGLGTMFGPGDAHLQEVLYDKNKEQKLYESLFLSKLEPFYEEMEKDNYDPRRYYTAAALVTVIARVFGVRLLPGGHGPERWPTFVNREKSFKTRLMGRYSRKLNVQGHQFVAQQYFTVISCNNCHQIIYGIGPQGYQCSVCLINLHRPCVKLYDDACPGPISKKDRGISKLITRMRQDPSDHRRKPSAHFIQMEKDHTKSMTEEGCDVLLDTSGDGKSHLTRSGSDRRPEGARDHNSRNVDGDGHDQAADNASATSTSTSSAPSVASNKKRASSNINRSESVKEVSEKRKQRRNISDPSHNSAKTANSGNVEVDHSGVPTPLLSGSILSNTDSGSSSNSSISYNDRLSESPSNSAEVLASPAAVNSDSDMDVDDPLNWQDLVTEEQLKNLRPHEKKRQDVINELFQTEASHVRSLKVLYKIFYKTLQENQSLKNDELLLVFPNIKEVLDVHTNISREMRKKRKDDPLVSEIGDLLASVFDERLRKAAATFCERQQQSLDFIKDKRKRDSKFDGVLCECEKKRQCRRLPLQGILPVEMQRLSKYPLLLERLIDSITEHGDQSSEKVSDELAKLKRAHQQCKDILNHVNEAAKLASNKARLEEIQRHLDTSSFERVVENTVAQEFRCVDLTRYTYILEGPMHLRRPNKGPVPVHIILLEEAVVLLQREGERYLLKFFQSGSSAQPQPLSPIIKMSTLLVRTNAVHKSALFLVNTSTNNSQMYDLIAEDDSKRDQWFKHFSDAADTYNKREGKAKRPDSSPDVPSSDNHNHLHRQDNEHERVEEMVQPENAVAEVTTSSSPSIISSEPTDVQSDDAALHPASDVIGDGTVDPNTRVGPDDWPLIQPSQVQVVLPPIHTAESKLTPLEQIRRKDEQVRRALADKEELVADLFNIPREHFNHIADIAGENQADITEMILSAIHQVDQLHLAVNKASTLTEMDAVTATSGGALPACASQDNLHQKSVLPSVPSQILIPIASTLSTQLTSLLSMAKHLEEERELYRKEVHRLRERLHEVNELHPSDLPVQQPAEPLDEPTPTTPKPTTSTRSNRIDADDVDTSSTITLEEHEPPGPPPAPPV